ncbi:hypothetical protein [Sphingomonas hengshuiensis]|nr:hypothetical protein [Sphingomonas hengshuiensis]
MSPETRRRIDAFLLGPAAQWVFYALIAIALACFTGFLVLTIGHNL